MSMSKHSKNNVKDIYLLYPNGRKEFNGSNERKKNRKFSFRKFIFGDKHDQFICNAKYKRKCDE